METAREYSEQVLACSTDDADIPVEFASRMWKKPIPVDIQDRINEISIQFTGAGWKNLPQEPVDDILCYLLDYLLSLAESLLPDVQAFVRRYATSHPPTTRVFGVETGGS